MVWYKAWRESEARMLLSASAITGLCVAFVLFHREAATIFDRPHTYVEYIWRIVYKGYLREMFVLLALLLGVGGLMRERDHGTAGFTLALPIGRTRLVAARAAIGLLEVALLSFLPALVIPALSPVVGQSYSWPQALEFGVLWAVGGALIYAIGLLASVLFAGEYTAPVVAFVTLLLYSAVVEVPFVERHVADVHDLMSGTGMPYFRPDICLLVGPLPWTTLALVLLTVFSLVLLAGRITGRQDF